jgi:hypothetical protein
MSLPYYNSYLLDELHRLFPAILYDQTQFQNNELVQYMRSRMRDVYNLYDAATNDYARVHSHYSPVMTSNTPLSSASQRSASTGSLQESVRINARYAGTGQRRRRRRNAIYSGWTSVEEENQQRRHPPIHRNTPQSSTHTSPQTSAHPSPQEPRPAQFTVRSFLDSAAAVGAPPHTTTQELSNDTLTAILGLLSFPTSSGNTTPQSISLNNPIANSSIYATPILQYPLGGYSYLPPSTHTTQRNTDQSWAEILASFMNPVPIRPTQEQIDHATRLFLTDATTVRDSCVICFDAISDGQAQREIRACGHAFHRECIERHFHTSPRCPLCRHDIRTAAAQNSPAESAPTSNP